MTVQARVTRPARSVTSAARVVCRGAVYRSGPETDLLCDSGESAVLRRGSADEPEQLSHLRLWPVLSIENVRLKVLATNSICVGVANLWVALDLSPMGIFLQPKCALMKLSDRCVNMNVVAGANAAYQCAGRISLRRVYCMLSMQLVNMVGDGLLLMGTTLIIISKSDASRNLTLFLVSSAISGAITLMSAALALDSVSRRRVLIGIDVIRIFTAVLVAVFERASCCTTLLVIIGLCVGFSVPVYRPALNSYIGDIVPDELRRSANSLRSLSARISAIAGPALAAVLASLGAYRVIPLIVVVLAVASAATFRLGPTGNVPVEMNWQKREALAGFRHVRSQPWIFAVITHGAVQFGFVGAPLTIIAPLWFASKSDPEHYGYLAAVEALGAAVAILIVRSRRIPTWIAMPVLLTKIIALGVIAINASVVWLYPGYFVLGAGAGVFGILWVSALHEHVPAHLLGRVLAIDALGDNVLTTAGFFLTGVAVHCFAISMIADAAIGVLVVSCLVAAAVPGVISLGDRVGKSRISNRRVGKPTANREETPVAA